MASLEEIERYLTEEFGYDLSRTLDEIRPGYHHVEDCMRTMPEAFECFLESESYESALRNVMYIGGDTDTLCAIAGAVAEAYWGIPVSFVVKGQEYLDPDLLGVVERFNTVVHGRGPGAKDPYANNKYIKLAVAKAKESLKAEDMILVLEAVAGRIADHGQAPTPMVDMCHMVEALSPDDVILGKSFSFDHDLRLRMDTMKDEQGGEWFPLFTDEEELNRQPTTNVTLNVDIKAIVENGLVSDRVKGVVINPFGQPLPLPKDLLKLIKKLERV